MVKPTVKLLEHNPKWIKQFEEEKKKVNQVLGNEIIAIEHIGSTSIEGLAAKPIIDILVGIKNLEDFVVFIEP